jgi:hypothetical protein
MIHKKASKNGRFWRKFPVFSKTAGVVVVDEGKFREPLPVRGEGSKNKRLSDQ